MAEHFQGSPRLKRNTRDPHSPYLFACVIHLHGGDIITLVTPVLNYSPPIKLPKLLRFYYRTNTPNLTNSVSHPRCLAPVSGQVALCLLPGFTSIPHSAPLACYCSHQRGAHYVSSSELKEKTRGKTSTKAEPNTPLDVSS